jgi:periplasmic protein TonB
MEAEFVREEKNNKTVAVIGTIIVHALILLFFFYYVIVTPLPPYKLIPAPEVEVEADFGNNINGTGHVEQDRIGENPNPDTKDKSQAQPVNTQQSAAPVTNDAEDASIKTPHKSNPKARIDTTESTPKPTVSVDLANAMNKFKHAKGNPGGDGNSGHEGNAGTPDGKTPGEGNGTGDNFDFFLAGRELLSRPNITANTQDEGKVVVRILVDQTGTVIKATPGEKGSTTTSPVLYAKAKAAALATKFNASPDGTPEQQGTMTFIFVVQ